jgi:hypothetical protein
MTITSENECKRVWKKFSEKTSTGKYFCAKGDENNFAYDFDHPLFMKINGKWYLRGLLIGLGSKPTRIMIYEDQSTKFFNWISSNTQ